jgi:hypothetical protein
MGEREDLEMPSFEEELKKLIHKYDRVYLNYPFGSDAKEELREVILVAYIHKALRTFNTMLEIKKESNFDVKTWEQQKQEQMEQILKEGGFYK